MSEHTTPSEHTKINQLADRLNHQVTDLKDSSNLLTAMFNTLENMKLINRGMKALCREFGVSPTGKDTIATIADKIATKAEENGFDTTPLRAILPTIQTLADITHKHHAGAIKSLVLSREHLRNTQ